MNPAEGMLGVPISRTSFELRRCLTIAHREAVMRGASLVSICYCALALLKQQSVAEFYIPNRQTYASREKLLRELATRLPPILKRAPADVISLPASEELARLIRQYGFLEDSDALLNVFLFNPDDTLAEAIACA